MTRIFNVNFKVRYSTIFVTLLIVHLRKIFRRMIIPEKPIFENSDRNILYVLAKQISYESFKKVHAKLWKEIEEIIKKS